MRRLGWLAVVLMAAASSSAWAAAKCEFVYTPEFREAVVLPALKRIVGEAWPNYDNPRPLVTVEGQRVSILLGDIRPNVLDAPYVGIQLEDCGRGATEVVWVSPFPESPQSR